MSISGRIPRISSGAEARKVVSDTLAAASTSDRAALRKLFGSAAGADGNRHLSAPEATMVRDAFNASVAGGDYDLEQVAATVGDQIAALVKARDPDGIKTYFSSTNKHLDDVVINGFTDVIAQANGKPVEFNIMIFAFTDPQIAKAILDLAEQHDNVTFRLITDFGQTSSYGGRKPGYIEQQAKARGLDNVQVKFKRDGAFIWSDTKERAVYHHGSSKGLNHHKGYVALIDGKPVKLVTGSFNWSDTAQKKNYENLFVVDGTNPANRNVLVAYQSEFAGFFNHADALSMQQARSWKRQISNDLRVANGLPAQAAIAPGPAMAKYVPTAPGISLDVNDMSDKSYARLESLVPDTSARRSIQYHFATYGAFTSWENLTARVSKVSKLSENARAKLRAALEYGDGRVPLNQASAGELMRGLKITKKQANAIIAARKKAGDFESVAQLKGLPGLSESVYARIAPRLNDDIGRAYFSSRGYDDPKAGTGYGAYNADKTFPVMGPDGAIEVTEATLAAGVQDLLRRAKAGDEVKLAMYGLSAGSPEYAEIVDAASRGVKFKIVLNKAYNGGVAAALTAMGVAGLPIDVRIQKSKTMHMKFGVLNDDVFQGSANFSTSSMSKHSEDRFVVKNNAQLAGEFSDEFDLVWGKSKPV